jgi:hypothetical protein
MAASDEAKALWVGVYDKFEVQYRQVYLKEEGVKTKAHIDHCVDLTGNSIIHEPQMKWCLILFIDAMVHIATNSAFSAKALSCVERRQFNQHKTLRDSITEMLDMDIDEDGISSAELDGHWSEKAELTAAPVQLKKSVATVTPEMFERDLCAPPLSKKRDHANVDAADQTDSDGEVDLLLLNKRHAATRDATHFPPIPAPTTKSSKNSDKKSYRAWLETWGSFTQLEEKVQEFSAGGKSSGRHLTITRSLIRQLAFIPLSGLNASAGPVNVVAGADSSSSGPHASWTEVFQYVLNHPGQAAPVPARAARKSNSRRQSKMAAADALPPFVRVKDEPGVVPLPAARKAEVRPSAMVVETNVIMDDFFDGFSHAYVPDTSFGQSSAASTRKSVASVVGPEVVPAASSGAMPKAASMDTVHGFSSFDDLCDDDFDLVQYYFGWSADDPDHPV